MSANAEQDSLARQRRRPLRAWDDEGVLRATARMADDVDVDPGPGLADDASDHRAARQALPARAPAGSHDDLRRVQGPCRVEKRGADVSADDLVVRAAELVEQLALLLEQGGAGRRKAVLRDHVDADEVALRALRNPCGAADQALTVGRAGQRDEDTLAGLPRVGDPVPRPVVREGLVDPVPDPGERELAERRQVARPEVVRERSVDPLGRIDVATCEAVAQRDRESGRRAGSRRHGARPRRGSSRAA